MKYRIIPRCNLSSRGQNKGQVILHGHRKSRRLRPRTRSHSCATQASMDQTGAMQVGTRCLQSQSLSIFLSLTDNKQVSSRDQQSFWGKDRMVRARKKKTRDVCVCVFFG